MIFSNRQSGRASAHPAPGQMMGDWTFFSNHGHVLVCLARDSEARLRDVAVQVGITERAVQKIVRDLQDEGYVEVSKHGRRNRYRINNRKALRHSLQAGCTVGQLLKLLSKPEHAKSDLPRPEADRAGEIVPRQPEKPARDPAAPETEPEKSPETGDKRGGGNLEQGQLF